jgi:hypothetical protein
MKNSFQLSPSPRAIRRHLLTALAVVANLLTPECRAEQAENVVYRTPQGIEYEVNAEGLCAIRSQGRELMRGGWSVFNGEGYFQTEPGPVKSSEILKKQFEKQDERHARVLHRKQDVRCVFDYAFDGEDLTISARVENQHPHAALAVTQFGGCEFTFASPPTGCMRQWHSTYMQANGIAVCHPSSFSPVGGSYAQDGAVGVGLSPWRTDFAQTLFLWDFTDWNLGKREKLPSRRLMYFVADPIPARGARTFDMRLRVSPNVDWHHLLEPYREHFQATFGDVRYKADYRWIASDYLNHSQKAVSAKNPYGFHESRRIDTAKGVAELCDAVIPVLRQGNAQGLLLWGQGGDDARGGMYRPDFDVLPPEVEAQWPVLVRRLREAGLKLGVCTRPRHMAVRQDWRKDQIIDINGADPGHQEMLYRRFQNMIERGCGMFYLDSFGGAFEDVKLMRVLRQKLGADVLTFCEHQCDALMPYSGGYSETTLHADEQPPRYRLWADESDWEIYQWLVPGAQMISRLIETKGKLAADIEWPEQWFFERRVTPLLPVANFARAGKTAALQAEFLTDPKTWKPAKVHTTNN